VTVGQAHSTQSWLKRRSSSVLLHLTSLPGPFSKGVLGEEAHDFIDQIAAAGFSVWQFLPLGPTHSHGSPYESQSSFAGNPDLLDLRECVKFGWLNSFTLDNPEHAQLRAEAAKGFWQHADRDPELAATVAAFEKAQADWLLDYSLFAALKKVYRNRPWWEWPEALRDRDAKALQQVRVEHADLIMQCVFEQLLFERQWRALKGHAEVKGVQLFGDLPIYVAHDSADVWTDQKLFTINRIGLCEEVAGVPPDYFSDTGQRWGNPLYRWDLMEKDGFQWWIRRVRRQLDRMHMLRIDHFRGLEAFWAIPGNSEDGVIGEWREAPGKSMLQALNDALGSLPMIAEDLGIITDKVTALREDFGLPGMKILHFAFGGDADNPYLPANHGENSVVYTGTHDNDTTMGWYASIDKATQANVLRELDLKSVDMPWTLIETALASPARLAVIPMQDLLELGSEARFNTPGTLHDNWQWRMDNLPSADAHCWTQALKLNKKYHR